MKNLNFIDLFAGAGGLSEGFVRTGYNPLAHIEKEKYPCDTLKTRSAYHWLKENKKISKYKKYLYEKKEKEDGSKLWAEVPSHIIDSVIQEAIGEDTIQDIFLKVDNLVGNQEVDVIIGGPPCQAYSLVGRARIGKDVEKDPRNELYTYYIKFLLRYKPKMFVFENVPGMLTARNGNIWKDFNAAIKNSGYTMEGRLIDASKYGVLQNRKRWIIIGWQTDLKHCKYPELKEIKNKFEVLKDLFSDLPIRKHGDGSLCEAIKYSLPITEMNYLRKYKIRSKELDFTTQHISRPNNENDREIYLNAINLWLTEKKRINYAELPSHLQKHRNKKTFLNRFNVVDPFGCSHTVVAHIAMDGHYYIYPTLNPTIENVRSITIREAARIQSFPDDYFFEGSRSSAFKQIGNAVQILKSA